MHWDDLPFWGYGEWQVLEEHLNDLKGRLCPKKKNLFAALDATPLEDVRVCFVGQDPYTDTDLATGIAFSIPKAETRIPPSLANIIHEYSTDLHYPSPQNGDLTKWCKEGVLLWNAIPSCEAGISLSHEKGRVWDLWSYLTRDMCAELIERDAVFVLCGRVAQEKFRKYLPETYNKWIIDVSHPSPRGVKFGKSPFIGSRVFTRVNALLCDLGKPTINWRL